MFCERLPAMAHVHYNKVFGALMAEALGGLSLRIAAEQCKLSHTTLAGMVQGKVPRPDTLTQVLNGLNVGADLRAKLFHEAGYVEKRGAAASVPNERDLIADAVEERVRRLLADNGIVSPSAEPMPRPESGAEIFYRGLVELTREFHLSAIPVVQAFSDFEELTPDHARFMLVGMRAALELEHEKQPEE